MIHSSLKTCVLQLLFHDSVLTTPIVDHAHGQKAPYHRIVQCVISTTLGTHHHGRVHSQCIMCDKLTRSWSTSAWSKHCHGKAAKDYQY